MDDLDDVVEAINQVCREKQRSLLFHQTKFEYLESILKDGGLLPLSKRTQRNFSIGYEEASKMGVYEDSVFVSLKSPNYDTPSFRRMFINEPIHT